MFAVFVPVAAPPRRRGAGRSTYASQSLCAVQGVLAICNQVSREMRNCLRVGVAATSALVRCTWRASCCCVRSAVVEGSEALSFSCLSAGFVRRASHPIQASTEASVDRPTTLPVQRQSSEADDKTKRTPAYLLPKSGTHRLQASNQASTAAPATGSQLPQHLLQQRKHSSLQNKAAPPARHRRDA